MTDTIANMTLDELKQLINDLLDERHITSSLGDMEEADLGLDDEPDTRTLEQVFDDIERHRWTPPPSAPSPSQMIREDRDSR